MPARGIPPRFAWRRRRRAPSSRLHERLVHEHREIHPDVAAVGDLLDHVDEDEALPRIHLVLAAVRTAPVEGADGFHPAIRTRTLHRAEAEPEALAVLRVEGA